MMRIEAAGRSIVRILFVAALLVAIGIGALGAFYETEARQAHREAERADVLDGLGVLGSELQGRIDADIQLMRGLAAVLAYHPGMGQAEFSRLGAELIRDRSEIRSIAASPGLIVRLVHPLEANRAVLGLDQRSIPGQVGTVLAARDLGSTVFAGPSDLVQGGRGFLIRAPVFVGADGRSRFWGVVSTVIDEARFYAAAGLAPGRPDLDMALVGRDGGVFFGDPGILARDPVRTEVVLPVGSWELLAVPAGGWTGPSGLWWGRAAFVVAGLLLVLPMLAVGGHVTSRHQRLVAARAREAELSRLSWRLEFALTASNVGVWDVELATGVLMWDERAKRLFGVEDPSRTFGDADWVGVLHPDDRERAIAEANAAVESNGRFVSEYRIVRPDGAVRHIRDMAACYEAPDGSRRLVGLVWDVTADVERERELDRRRLEAEAETAAKSRFLAAMSHEIRTPMTGVLGVLGLMIDDPVPQKQHERARIALASAENLLEILNDILDYSKLEAKQIRVVEELVDVRRLVGEVAALMEPAAAAKGLALGVEIAEAVPAAVTVDPMRLRQVLTNLLSNATKFTEAGTIAVRVGYAPSGGGSLEVEVEDTGIGIGEAEREQIFLHFVQVDNSLTRRAGGTGLGLAISKQLVELMGGEISVRSVPGMGSCFAFTVEARRAPASAVPADGEEPEAAGLEPLRVLLAEDHATNQYLIGAYLRAAGHAVTVVANGREAVERAAEGGFDVVLMDVQMPELDGLSATREIRAGPAAEVPVIALTANAMPGDRDACLAAGMNDYLPKPLEIAALRAALFKVCPDRRVAGPGGRSVAV
jgi:signal transduction histidine kinase/CheY-like chemotaxis protein